MSFTEHQVAAAGLQRSLAQPMVKQPIAAKVTHSTSSGLFAAKSVAVPVTSSGTAHRDDHNPTLLQGRLLGLARAQQSSQHESQKEKRALMTNAVHWWISLQMLSVRG